MSPRIESSLARMRPVALAAAATALAACHGGGGDEGADTSTGGAVERVCEAYVACAGAGDPGEKKALEGLYGAAGSCWLDVVDAQRTCVQTCADGVAGCDPSTGLGDAVLEVGQAIFDPIDPFATPTWGRLEDGDTLPVVLGGQGLMMFAIGLRGANFEIAADPFDFDDPKMPKLDSYIDIDGYNLDTADHFKWLPNYPIPFEPLAAIPGVNEFLYVAMIIPDEIPDPSVLDGLPGHLHMELQIFGEAPVVRDLDFVVSAVNVF